MYILNDRINWSVVDKLPTIGITLIPTPLRSDALQTSTERPELIYVVLFYQNRQTRRSHTPVIDTV